MGSLFISQAPPRFAPPAEINRFFLTPQISYHPKTQNCDEILFFCRTANGAHFLAPLCSARRTLRLAAGAASAPSEEGAGAPKGFRGATEGERTRACCLHRGIDEHRVKKRPFAFAIVYIKCFRTYSVYLSFRHGVFILYTPCHLPPQREARRLPPQATELQRCEPQLSPPTAGCPHPSRCSAKAQHRATFPKGKARAAAAAERRYCRCACRRSSAAGGAKAVFPKGKGFSPHKFTVFVAPGRVFCYNTLNNTQNAQKGLFV